MIMVSVNARIVIRRESDGNRSLTQKRYWLWWSAKCACRH